jgi:hypothetical protein
MTVARTHTEILIEQLDRHTQALAAILRRIERRELTGRNGKATEFAIQANLDNGRRLVRELCDQPEEYAPETQIAAPIDRFWKVERRALGLN